MYIRIVWSAPAVTIHGCVGWNCVSSTPKSFLIWCPLSTFSGTISALCIKSLVLTGLSRAYL